MKPPYRNPDNNTWMTGSLFWERWVNTEVHNRSKFVEPIFSLYQDKPGLINCRKTFVELGDPTGYKWSMKYLEDYEHWKALMKAAWFREAYDVWMNELKMKTRAEALDTIREIAANGVPAQSLVAAKYLAGFEWEKSSRGRPSKDEINGKLKEAVKALSEEDADAERIGLRVVK